VTNTNQAGTNGQRRVVICQNPTAGARSGVVLVDQLSQLLRDRGLQVESSTDPEQWSIKASQYLRQGELRAVVAAGGDGTVAHVANMTDSGTPIAVLPLGTENLLAKHLGMSTPAVVARAVHAGTQRQMDAGSANGRTFLLMASCGFDADVVHRLHHARRGHIHHFSYAKPILDSIRSYQYPELRVYCERPDAGVGTVDQTVLTESARWVFAVNLPRYAAGLRIAPGALENDGMLDVCTFRRGSLWNGLKYLYGVYSGQHTRWPDFCTRQASRFRIESDDEVPYQLDGDPGGYLPLEVEVLPAHVTMICPASRFAVDPP
jgi:YegS/Rv2252/BmrU family lipid kinase